MEIHGGEEGKDKIVAPHFINLQTSKQSLWLITYHSLGYTEENKYGSHKSLKFSANCHSLPQHRTVKMFKENCKCKANCHLFSFIKIVHYRKSFNIHTTHCARKNTITHFFCVLSYTQKKMEIKLHLLQKTV